MADRRIGSERPRRSWSAGDVQEALLISGQIPLWLVDGDDRIAFVNDAAVETLGFESDDELVGRPEPRLDPLHPPRRVALPGGGLPDHACHPAR